MGEEYLESSGFSKPNSEFGDPFAVGLSSPNPKQPISIEEVKTVNLVDDSKIDMEQLAQPHICKRKDVVQKTIFRYLRKYYIQDFKNFYNFSK